MAQQPRNRFRGIRTPMLGGYILGRTATGLGDVHQIPMVDAAHALVPHLPPALSAIADGQIVSNISGGSAVPVGNALSAILDHVLGATVGLIVARGSSAWEGETISALLDRVGNVRGDVLFRGAAGWSVLAPGTAGQVLTSGGAGADPSWSTVSVPVGANPTATAGPAAVNGVAATFMRSDAAPAVQLGTNAQKGLVQVDGTTITAAAGVITAALPVGANPSATAGPAAVNGSAVTFMRSDAAPAVQKASAAQFGIVEVDGTTITAAAGVISATQAVGANPTATGSDTAVNGAAATFMRSDAAPAIQKGDNTHFGVVKSDGTTITSASGVLTATGFVPLAAAFHPGYQAGRFYLPPFFATSGTIVIVADRLYAVPFYVGVTTTFTKIGIPVQTAGAAGKLARLGIYNNSNGQPSTLVLDAGTVSVGTGTSGTNQEATISQSLTPGWYFLALVSDGTPTLRNLGTDNLGWVYGLASPTSGTAQAFGPATFTFAALPSPFTAGGAYSGAGNNLLIYLKP